MAKITGDFSFRWVKISRKGTAVRIIVPVLLLVSQLIIFLPHVGRGFITDDFIWINSIIHNGEVDILRTFRETTGFFRPLVGVSFAVQYLLHGLNPVPYGLFNLFVHMLNIILVFFLLSGNKKTKLYAIFAALLFALNAKGSHHAVGWISGRSSLLFTFFLLLSLNSYLRVRKNKELRFFLTACFFFAALLSKEVAIITPLFVFAFVFINCPLKEGTADYRKRIKTGIKILPPFLFPLLFYLILRFNSNAMTPFNAPDCYTYNLSPLWILENICEYTIRAGLLDLYILLFLILMTFIAGKKVKKEQCIDWPIFFSGLLWFFIFLLPTLPLPCRSDLYVYYPQIGLHTSSVVIISHLWKRLNIKKGLQRYFIYTLIGIFSITWCGYLLKKADANAKKAECSALFTRQVVRAMLTKKPGSEIVIIDRHYRETYSPSKVVFYGFPSLLELYFPGQKFRGRIIAPHQVAETEGSNSAGHYFTWHNGSLVPMNTVN